MNQAQCNLLIAVNEIDRPALEERNVDDRSIEVDELKDDHFERVAVLIRRLRTVTF